MNKLLWFFIVFTLLSVMWWLTYLEVENWSEVPKHTFTGTQEFTSLVDAIDFQKEILFYAETENISISSEISKSSPPSVYFSAYEENLNHFPYGERKSPLDDKGNLVAVIVTGVIFIPMLSAALTLGNGDNHSTAERRGNHEAH